MPRHSLTRVIDIEYIDDTRLRVEQRTVQRPVAQLMLPRIADGDRKVHACAPSGEPYGPRDTAVSFTRSERNQEGGCYHMSGNLP